MKRLGILNDVPEAINHLFCGIFLCLLGMEMIGGATLLPELSRGDVTFISNYIFFNEAHAVLTLIFMYRLPAIRAWGKQYYGGSRRFLWRIALIFLTFFSLVFLEKSGLLPPFWGFAVRTFVIIFAFYHGVRQIQGLAVMYNQRIAGALESSEARARFQKHRRTEKRLFSGLIWTTVVGAILSQSSKGYFRHPLPAGSYEFFLKSSLLLCGVFIVLLFLNSWTAPGTNKSYKNFYLLRLLFIPFWPFYPMALLGRMSLHGIESLLIYDKIASVSAQGAASPKSLFSASLYALAIFMFLSFSANYTGALFDGKTAQDFPFDILLSACICVSLLHYYMEGALFKMENPISRKYIGPLLS